MTRNNITRKKRINYIQTIKKELILYGTALSSRVSSEIFSTKDSSLKISQRIKKKTNLVQSSAIKE